MLDARFARDFNILARNKGPFKVTVCLVTLVAFFVNIFSYDLAWAAGTPSGLTSVGPDRAGGPGLSKELNIETFILPEYLGHIKDSWQPSDNSRSKGLSPKGTVPTIVHIQDAHCNYAAQHKIAEIVEYLNKEYGVSEINLEGGAEGYDLSIFTDIKDRAIREKAADYFVKEGLVNGSEYFAINNPEKVNLWGIEDTKLYIDNLKAYRESLKYKDDVEKAVKSLAYILNNLKRHIYSKELFEFDMKYSQYKSEKIEFKEYLNYLVGKGKEKALDIKSFTNIFLLSQTLDEEANIDFRKANNQRDALIDVLQKKLSKNSLEDLVVKTLEFKAERITPKDFYAYLVKRAKAVNVDVNDFPELQKYIVYVSMYTAVDKSKIMEEIESLENKIKESLYQNDKDRELALLSKNLALTRNIFNISLTKDDYNYYKANEDSFRAARYISFIKKEAPLYQITATPDPAIEALDDHRENMSRFYEYSLRRDAAFIKNIKFLRTTNHEPRTTILVTGGFHTENLADLFKKHNIAYISIMPNFKNGNGYDCPYFKILSGEKNVKIKDTLLSVLENALATASQLNPAMQNAMNQAALSAAPTPETPNADLQPEQEIQPWQKEISEKVIKVLDTHKRKVFLAWLSTFVAGSIMWYWVFGLSVTVIFFANLAFSVYFHELGHWFPDKIRQYRSKLKGEQVFKTMDLDFGCYLSLPTHEFSSSIRQKLASARGGYIANLILLFVSLPPAILAIFYNSTFILTFSLSAVATVNFISFIQTVLPFLSDGKMIAEYKKTVKILNAAKHHYSLIPEEASKIRIEEMFHMPGSFVIKSNEGIYLVGESRKRKPKNSIEFTYLASSANFLPIKLKGELVKTAQGKGNFRFKDRYYAIYKIVNFPTELTGKTTQSPVATTATTGSVSEGATSQPKGEGMILPARGAWLLGTVLGIFLIEQFGILGLIIPILSGLFVDFGLPSISMLRAYNKSSLPVIRHGPRRPLSISRLVNSGRLGLAVMILSIVLAGCAQQSSTISFDMRDRNNITVTLTDGRKFDIPATEVSNETIAIAHDLLRKGIKINVEPVPSEAAVGALFLSAIYHMATNPMGTYLSLIPVLILSIVLHEFIHFAAARLFTRDVRFALNKDWVPSTVHQFDRFSRLMWLEYAFIVIAPALFQPLIAYGLLYVAQGSSWFGMFSEVFAVFNITYGILSLLPFWSDGMKFWNLALSKAYREAEQKRFEEEIRTKEAATIRYLLPSREGLVEWSREIDDKSAAAAPVEVPRVAQGKIEPARPPIGGGIELRTLAPTEPIPLGLEQPKPEERKAATIDLLQSEPQTATRDPIIIIGFPQEFAEREKFNPENFKRDIARRLGKNGHGSPINVHKFEYFYITENAQSTKDNLQNLLMRIKPEAGQEVVLFSPVMDNWGNLATNTELLETLTRQFGVNHTVVPDAYTDLAMPEVAGRIGIARLIAYYKEAEGYADKEARLLAQKDALQALSIYIEKVTGRLFPEPPTTLIDLLKKIKVLRIRPVDYNDFLEWKSMQEAVAASA